MGTLSVVPIKSAPRDLSARLREMADQVDRGEITDFVAAFIENDGHSLFWAASLSHAVVLSSMLQNEAVQRMRSV